MKLIFNSYDFLNKKTKQGLMRGTMLLIFLFTVFQLLGCYALQQTSSASPTPENKPVNTPQEKVEEKQINNTKIVDTNLEGSQRLWLENKIVDYNITIGAYQGGNISFADPVLIEVREGKTISIEPTSKSDERSIRIYSRFDTVEKIFNQIQKGYEDGAKVEAKYNKKFGYPEKVSIDYASVSNGEGGTMGVDDWISMKITKFEIIDK